MKLSNLGIVLGLVVAGTLADIPVLQAATVTTTIDGRMGATGQGCLQLLTVTVGDSENCMYNGGPFAPNIPFLSATTPPTVPTPQYPAGESIGPFSQEQYYDSVAKPQAFSAGYVATPGDGKIRPVIAGTVTIDDNSTASAADDLISFTITLRSPGSGDVIRNLGSSQTTSTAAEDRYTTMTQVLAPHPVNAATPNAFGGFDYVIGSAGFPTRLTFTDSHANESSPGAGDGPCVGQLFGDMECTSTFNPGITDTLVWTPWASPGSGRPGLGSLEGNTGARTVGSLTGYDCIDTGTNNGCTVSKVSFGPRQKGPNNAPGVNGVTAEDVGWDQLYLRVSTDASGKVIAMEGYPVQEYQVFGPGKACGSDAGATISCNTWLAEYFDSSGIAADNDGPVNVPAGASTDISVLANDRGFADPVTVTILTPPLQGTAVVNGSPGSKAGITITYTAGNGATGADSFVYKVNDGTNNDTATVSVDVIATLGARADNATTTPGTPVNINVAANDVVLGATATVTINNGSFSSGGQAQVITASNGGPLAGIIVTYTPSTVTPPGPPSYIETFTYTIDDGGASPPSTARVSVYLDLVPVAKVSDDPIKAPDIVISTQGSDPLGLTGIFDAPGPGGSLGNAGGTSAITITANGAHGTATVALNQITYTITDPVFYSGTDSFTYQVKDADGETSSAVVAVGIKDITPAFISPFPNIAADQDHSSTKLGLPFVVTYGNGARDLHHTVTISTPAQHGTCAVTPANGNGSLVYTPQAGYFGADTCTITIADVDGQTGSAVASITVNPVLTVTPKIGGAGMDPWTLSIFAVAPFLRRRRARVALRSRATAGVRLALLAALLGAGVAAFGQEAPATPAEKNTATVGEIVVTARKVEEKLKDIPLAITAFNEETIAATGIANLGDIANLTPGLSFFNAFGGQLPVPVIRGVVPTDIFGQNNAALFVDGVYLAGREGLDFSQLDVANIEVLKGPQSALYGRNAFSGAINFTTKRPSSEFEAKADGSFGNAGITKGSFSVSGPLLGDSLRGRLAMSYDDWDGSYSNAISGANDVGGHKYRSYQGALEWLPTDNLDVYLTSYISNDRIDEPAVAALPTNCEDQVEPPAGIPPASGKPNLEPTPGARLSNYCGKIPGIRAIPGLDGGTKIPHIAEATGEERQLDRSSLRVDWTLPDVGTLTSLSGFSYTRDQTVSDFGRSLGYNQRFLYCTPASTETAGTPNNCAPPGSYSPANQIFTAGAYNTALGARTTEFSQELRFTSPRDQRLRYTAGAYWYKTQILTRESYLTLAKPGCNPITACLPASYGFAPFDAAAPNLAIGTAIFYGLLTPDGGSDPLRRIQKKELTQGWKVFTHVDLSITDRLTANGEISFNPERREIRKLGYTPCRDKTAATVAGCGDDFYNLNYTSPIYPLDGVCTGLDGVVYAIGQCSAVATTHYNLLTGRGGLDFKFSDDWMVYGSVAFGKKPGGVNLVTGTVVCPNQNAPKACDSAVAGQGGQKTIATVDPNAFDPEYMIAYELGLKGYGFDRRVGLDLAVYYNDWRNVVTRQIIDTDPVTGLGFSQPTAFNVNSGTAHVVGVEATTNVAFTENLKGDFTFGWTDAKIVNARLDTFSRFPSFRADCGQQPADPNQLRDWYNACNLVSGDVSGNTLLRQPEFKASASLSYLHELVGDWNWFARADATYQSSVYVNLDNESWLPGHTYVNTKLGASSPRFTFNVWARNLFNDGHPIAAFRDIYFANTTNLYPPFTNQGPRPNFDSFVPLRLTVTYPDERTIGVSATVRFGAAIK